MPGSIEELEELKDLHERDLFAQRLAQKDKKEQHTYEDHNHDKNTSASLGELRIRSRQSYLEKREVQQVELLKIAIKDEEELFEDVPLTRQELSDLSYKKKVAELASQKMSLEELSKVSQYTLPESNPSPQYT